eukprot:4230099-Prorocentrum_lima.AAC.1
MKRRDEERRANLGAPSEKPFGARDERSTGFVQRRIGCPKVAPNDHFYILNCIRKKSPLPDQDNSKE